MAGLEIVRRSLRSYRRPLAIWVLSLAAMGLLLTLFWPSIRDASGIDELIQNLPEAMRALIGTEDLLSPEGFLGSRLNSIFPLLIMIYAVFRISDEVAGEEQRGGFEVLLGVPLPRTTLLLAKFASAVIAIVVLMEGTGVAILVGASVVSMDISFANVLATTTSLALLGTTFASIALAVAGLTGSRGITLGTGTGLAVAAFFLYSFAPLTPALEGLRPFTLVDQAVGNEPLRNGIAAVDVVILLAVTILAVAVAAIAFRRRDLHGT